MANGSPRALDGVRVLDLSRVLAGPFCTMLLGDLGAEFLKVEEPSRGDETRAWGPPWVGEGDGRLSAYFHSVNRNKKSLAVDLKAAEGQRLVRQLAVRSQVLVENFKPGGLAQYGLSYPDLEQINPSLVYCSISGYGQQGPYRERPGYDTVIQAMSGLMSITGPPEGPPYKVGVAISDVLTGLYAATSILAALRHAEQTGRGQWLDLALLDCQLASLVNVAGNYLAGGRPSGRHGNQHANIVPYQPFEASDGAFMLAVGNDRQFGRLCRLLGHPEWTDDERFRENSARVANREALVALLEPAFREGTRQHWVERLLEAGIPAGPIRGVDEALEDEHVAARGLLRELGGSRTVGPAPGFSETPPCVQLPPPGLGEHTREVLRDVLGLGEAEVDRLVESEVVARPSRP